MRRAAVLACAIALPAAAGLGGCGFTPLYGEAGMAPALEGVAVVTPDHSRLAYLLREQLDTELARDRERPPSYRLLTTLTSYRAPLGVRVNNVANRYEIGLTVRWRLQDAHTGAVVTQGTSIGRVSYDASDQPYGQVAAEQNGEERAADQAALAIRVALARWFTLHPPVAAAPPSAAP